MTEESKEDIYKVLKKNFGKKFALVELHKKLQISYPTLLKWVNVLIAETSRDPPVREKNYGNVRLVWVGNDK